LRLRSQETFKHNFLLFNQKFSINNEVFYTNFG
jgi:hypothetical protein